MLTRRIRIQFVDTDASKRIHYSSIFRYFEILDHEFFRKIGHSYKQLFQEGIELPRIQVECQYLGSIEYDDELDAEISIVKVGNSSFTYSFEFYKEKQLMVRGGMTLVFINSSTGKKISIPESIKPELEKHLKLAPMK